MSEKIESKQFSLECLRKTLYENDTKIFYKDIELIYNDTIDEWKSQLDNNVEKYGLNTADLFTFSIRDSIYIIKSTEDGTEQKLYDITDNFVKGKKQKVCRIYKASTFFRSKQFLKYIHTVFDDFVKEEKIK